MQINDTETFTFGGLSFLAYLAAMEFSSVGANLKLRVYAD
jgi:hypothetical protein